YGVFGYSTLKPRASPLLAAAACIVVAAGAALRRGELQYLGNSTVYKSLAELTFMFELFVVFLGVVVFTAVVIGLVLIILGAKKAFVPSGDVHLLINDSKDLTISAGGKLLGALADNGIF